MKLVPVIAQPYFLEKVSRYRAGSPDRAKWIESLWQTPGGGVGGEEWPMENSGDLPSTHPQSCS